MTPGKGSQPVSAQERQALAYAKRGIVLAALSGLIFAVTGLLIQNADAYAPFSDKAFWILTPFICAGLHDFCACMAITFLNWRSGRLPELKRSILSKPGRVVILGALIGALFGQGGYMTALRMSGPAYVLPITSMYPAVAAVMAVFVLKEKIPPRAWLGLGLCIVGAAAVGYTPPDGQVGTLFYWGLFFAILAAAGWGAEGVWVTSGMDFIEPVIALNIYYMVSTLLSGFIISPLLGAFFFAEQGGPLAFLNFLRSEGAIFVVIAGLVNTVSYICWYKAMNMTGVSRAMALNISYALWGIVLSSIFTEVHITVTLVLGALVIFAGMFLVIGNPRDMLNLRKTD